MSRSTTLAARAVATEPGPRVTLWVLRLFAVVTIASVAVQPLLAGIYLDGSVKAILAHGNNGHVLTGLVFGQLIASAVYRFAGHGAGWPLHANITLLIAATSQVGFGYAGFVAVHVPLGIAILACQLGMTIWLCTPAAGRVRRVRRRRHGENEQHQEKGQEAE